MQAPANNSTTGVPYMPGSQTTRQYFRARWILPVDQPPIENGCIVVEGEKIAGIIPAAECPQGDVKDFGNAMITPGFFNLHTHLDYTGLRHFDTDSPFFIWIDKLIGLSWQWKPEQWRKSALHGARDLALSGTTFAVDASYSGAAAYGLAGVGLRGVVGLELFGVVEEKADAAWQLWLQKYHSFMEDADENLRASINEGKVRVTVAPHTPYTVCPALLRKADAWAREQQLPLLIHIAESEMECCWIRDTFPPLDNFLSRATGETVETVAALPWRGHGKTPVEHLAHHKLLNDGVLAAHTVKLTDADIALLAENGVSTAHCPRSNSRLRNGIAPFTKLVAAGLHVGFGTDSAASTDDLDVLSEARFAWNLHRAVNPEFTPGPEDALYHLTLGAARAMGVDTSLGSLTDGKFADFCVFSLDSLPDLAQTRPQESLLYGGVVPTDVFVGGCPIVVGGKLPTRD